MFVRVPTPAPTTGLPTFTGGAIPAISFAFGPGSAGMDVASRAELCAGALAEVNRVGAMALSAGTVGCEVSSMGVVTTRFCAESGISEVMAARLASIVAGRPITVALAGSPSAPASSVTTTGTVSFGVDTCVATPVASVTRDAGSNGGTSTTTPTTVDSPLANTNDNNNNNNNNSASTSTAWLWILVVVLLLGVVFAMVLLWRRRQKENDKVFGSLQASRRASQRAGSTATYGNRSYGMDQLDGGYAAAGAAADDREEICDNYLHVVGSSADSGTATGAAIAGFSNPSYPDHSIAAAAAAAPASGGGGPAAIGGPESTYGGDVYAIPMAGGEGDVYAVMPISGESATVYNTSQEFQESCKELDTPFARNPRVCLTRVDPDPHWFARVFACGRPRSLADVDRNAAGTSRHVALPQSAYDQDPGLVAYSEADDATDRETPQSSYDAVEPYGAVVPPREDEQTDYDTVDDTAATTSPAAFAGLEPTYGGDVYAVPLEGGGVAAIYGDATEVVDYAMEAYSQPVDSYAAAIPAVTGGGGSGSVRTGDTYDAAVDAVDTRIAVSGERHAADSVVHSSDV